MDKDKVKLQKSIRNSLAKQGVDFLVPFISSVVSILTSHDYSSVEVKKQLKKLKIENIRTQGNQIESQCRILDFKVYYASLKYSIFIFHFI